MVYDRDSTARLASFREGICARLDGLARDGVETENELRRVLLLFSIMGRAEDHEDLPQPVSTIAP